MGSRTVKGKIVGNAVPGVPTGASRNLGTVRINLPIEAKFIRRNAGDGVPYGIFN